MGKACVNMTMHEVIMINDNKDHKTWHFLNLGHLSNFLICDTICVSYGYCCQWYMFREIIYVVSTERTQHYVHVDWNVFLCAC